MKFIIKFCFVRFVQIIGRIFFNIKAKEIKIKREKINRILVIRLDEIGDVVMTIPLLRTLRKNYPNAKVTLIVKPQVYNLVEYCPYVNNVLPYQWQSGRFSFFKQILKSAVFGRRFLKKEQFDIALVPRWDVDGYFASFLAFFSGAPIRLAYSETVNENKRQENKGYDGFFSQVVYESVLKHEVERNLFWIKYMDGEVFGDQLEFWQTEDDNKWAKQFLDKNAINENDFLVVVFPSAGNKRREWPVLKFVKLIQQVSKNEKRAKFIILGDSKNTKVIGDKIIHCCPSAIDGVGKMTLRQLAALLMQADFYIGGDTGPMHLAAAVGLPGVVISCHPIKGKVDHENSPDRFGPWGAPMRICRPQYGIGACENGCIMDYAHCIEQIEVEDVWAVVKEYLKFKSDFDI